MATQKCPRCKSKRVRLGYRPTSLFKKLTFRYNLLCDDCNWEFSGFAVPGTVSCKTRKKKQIIFSGKLEPVCEVTKDAIENKDFLLSQKKDMQNADRDNVKKKMKVKMP